MNILIISGCYSPEPGASAKIANDLAKQFIKLGNQVDVITKGKHFSEQTNDCCESIHYVKKTSWDILQDRIINGQANKWNHLLYTLLAMIRRIFLTFFIRRFPNAEPISTFRMKQEYKMIARDKNIDVVLAFFRPFSCLDIGYDIKRKNKNILLVSYYLDLVEDQDCPKYMPLQLYRCKIQKADRRIFDASDVVILPKSVEGKKDELYFEFKDKLRYMEFPTFTNHNRAKLDNSTDNEVITFVFAGTLDRNFRNPLKLLECINYLAEADKSVKYILRLYGSSNCSDIISNFNKTRNFEIIEFGKVEKRVVDEANEQATFLVNIMNDYSSIVPSKIFELFALCKPIINVVTNGDDGSLKYFEKYPLCFSVVSSQMSNNYDEFQKFVTNSRGKKVDFEEIKKTYFECTPDFVAKSIIDDLFSEGKNG